MAQAFNALYVKTDGDVVENAENTRRDVDLVLSALQPDLNSRILDLCCGQGRHALELARRGYSNVMGLDRSRYLIRLAKKRAQAENCMLHSAKETHDGQGWRRATSMPS